MNRVFLAVIALLLCSPLCAAQPSIDQLHFPSDEWVDLKLTDTRVNALTAKDEIVSEMVITCAIRRLAPSKAVVAPGRFQLMIKRLELTYSAPGVETHQWDSRSPGDLPEEQALVKALQRPMLIEINEDYATTADITSLPFRKSLSWVKANWVGEGAINAMMNYLLLLADEQVETNQRYPTGDRSFEWEHFVQSAYVTEIRADGTVLALIEGQVEPADKGTLPSRQLAGMIQWDTSNALRCNFFLLDAADEERPEQSQSLHYRGYLRLETLDKLG